MKLLYFAALFIITISLTACDGRDRLSMTPQEVLQENKLLDSFSEQNVRFIPADYAEKTTDTIFSNGYVVHVKMYTDMENFITVNLNGEKVNFRDFNLDIKVIKDNKTILSLNINKESEIHEQLSDDIDLRKYYLRDMWVAKDNNQHRDLPCIYFEYFSPETKDSQIQRITPFKKNDVKFMTSVIIN